MSFCTIQIIKHRGHWIKVNTDFFEDYKHMTGWAMSKKDVDLHLDSILFNDINYKRTKKLERILK
jgi:hypothetical protein